MKARGAARQFTSFLSDHLGMVLDMFQCDYRGVSAATVNRFV